MLLKNNLIRYSLSLEIHWLSRNRKQPTMLRIPCPANPPTQVALTALLFLLFCFGCYYMNTLCILLPGLPSPNSFLLGNILKDPPKYRSNFISVKLSLTHLSGINHSLPFSSTVFCCCCCCFLFMSAIIACITICQSYF